MGSSPLCPRRLGLGVVRPVDLVLRACEGNAARDLGASPTRRCAHAPRFASSAAASAPAVRRQRSTVCTVRADPPVSRDTRRTPRPGSALRSPFIACAVSATIGTVPPPGSARIAPVACRPDMPGICMSMMTRSGSVRRQSAIACRPLAAVRESSCTAAAEDLAQGEQVVLVVFDNQDVPWLNVSSAVRFAWIGDVLGSRGRVACASRSPRPRAAGSG